MSHFQSDFARSRAGAVFGAKTGNRGHNRLAAVFLLASAAEQLFPSLSVVEHDALGALVVQLHLLGGLLDALALVEDLVEKPTFYQLANLPMVLDRFVLARAVCRSPRSAFFLGLAVIHGVLHADC